MQYIWSRMISYSFATFLAQTTAGGFHLNLTPYVPRQISVALAEISGSPEGPILYSGFLIYHSEREGQATAFLLS